MTDTLAQSHALEKLYRLRFSEADRMKKEQIWTVLCESFFQPWISHQSTVLELAAGYGEFIRNIRAGRKIAFDLNPETKRILGPDVEFYLSSALDLSAIENNSIDTVFSSNFFEHLHNKTEMDQVLKESFRVLKPGGRYLCLQPNLQYVGQAYWDFYDHELPLTHRSAQEAFTRQGFLIDKIVPRFLPYTMKSRLPQAPWLVRLYLALPFAWRIFGKQFFLVAQKPT